MQVTVSRISPVVLELVVDVPPDAVKAEVERVYTSLAKTARVRGYRPGKAPRPVLKTLYGAQVESDVANNLVNAMLPRALTEKNVTPIGQPTVVDASRPSGSTTFTFKARMEVQPELTEVKFEGFTLYRPKVEVSDAEVDAQIEALRVRHATLKAPEPARPSTSGDVVTIDFSLEVDGKEVADGGGQGVQLELGAGQALPELDAALLGKQIGDEVEVDAQFQPNHPRKDFQGKVGHFKVKITELKERNLPAIDDELAKDIGNFSTVVELRADIHTRLEKAAKERSETAVAEQIVQKLNELNPCEVPPSLVLQQAQMLQQELAAQARRMGQRFTQQQAEELGRAVLADAERKVRAGLVMADIARRHQFQVTQEDLEKGYAELAQETGKNVAKVRVEYREKAKHDVLVGMILEDKILDFIEGKSTIIDGDPPAVEASSAETPAAEAAKAEGGDSPAADAPADK